MLLHLFIQFLSDNSTSASIFPSLNGPIASGFISFFPITNLNMIMHAIIKIKTPPIEIKTIASDNSDTLTNTIEYDYKTQTKTKRRKS